MQLLNARARVLSQERPCLGPALLQFGVDAFDHSVVTVIVLSNLIDLLGGQDIVEYDHFVQ